MKKWMKITICVMLCLAASWLVEQGIRLLLPDNPVVTCQKACEELAKKGDVHVISSGGMRNSDRFWENINWGALSGAAWVKEDKETNQLIFLVDHGYNNCMMQRYTTLYTFQFDEEGQLTGLVYLSTRYKDMRLDENRIQEAKETKLTIHCFDRENCLRSSRIQQNG